MSSHFLPRLRTQAGAGPGSFHKRPQLGGRAGSFQTRSPAGSFHKRPQLAAGGGGGSFRLRSQAGGSGSFHRSQAGGGGNSLFSRGQATASQLDGVGVRRGALRSQLQSNELSGARKLFFSKEEDAPLPAAALPAAAPAGRRRRIDSGKSDLRVALTGTALSALDGPVQRHSGLAGPLASAILQDTSSCSSSDTDKMLGITGAVVARPPRAGWGDDYLQTKQGPAQKGFVVPKAAPVAALDIHPPGWRRRLMLRSEIGTLPRKASDMRLTAAKELGSGHSSPRRTEAAARVPARRPPLLSVETSASLDTASVRRSPHTRMESPRTVASGPCSPPLSPRSLPNITVRRRRKRRAKKKAARSTDRKVLRHDSLPSPMAGGKAVAAAAAKSLADYGISGQDVIDASRAQTGWSVESSECAGFNVVAASQPAAPPITMASVRAVAAAQQRIRQWCRPAAAARQPRRVVVSYVRPKRVARPRPQVVVLTPDYTTVDASAWIDGEPAPRLCREGSPARRRAGPMWTPASAAPAAADAAGLRLALIDDLGSSFPRAMLRDAPAAPASARAADAANALLASAQEAVAATAPPARRRAAVQQKLHRGLPILRAAAAVAAAAEEEATPLSESMQDTTLRPIRAAQREEVAATPAGFGSESGEEEDEEEEEEEEEEEGMTPPPVPKDETVPQIPDVEVFGHPGVVLRIPQMAPADSPFATTPGDAGSGLTPCEQQAAERAVPLFRVVSLGSSGEDPTLSEQADDEVLREALAAFPQPRPQARAPKPPSGVRRGRAPQRHRPPTTFDADGVLKLAPPTPA
eukprot:TRINITY_DN4060_c0_g2_i1.p1 TRINITY_DN4060_c0_g2~~TRINITY_DN4060_c0_g2_i1.p1  ORF type:complete len:840 (+),score=313.49 TRINITY_DN4060_c0_g2_i1:98-2521(+)